MDLVVEVLAIHRQLQEVLEIRHPHRQAKGIMAGQILMRTNTALGVVVVLAHQVLPEQQTLLETVGLVLLRL